MFSIKASDIAVPEGDPFENDLFDTREKAEAISRVISSTQTPYVIGVDAEWGAGKTTFLRMLCQHLRNQGFHVVEFNAWETDFAGSPFEALSAELTQKLETSSSVKVRNKTKRLRAVANRIAGVLASAVLTSVASQVPFIGPATAKALLGVANMLGKDRTSQYARLQREIQTFKATMAEISKELADQNQGRPLVIAIDELDRCRPSYAIELLETAKHFFSTSDAVFVLAVNSAQLAHSVRSIYGAQFDAEGYLARFFDLPLRLINDDRERFVRQVLDETGLLETIRARARSSHAEFSGLASWSSKVEIASIELLRTLLNKPDLGLRQARQAANRLNLTLSLMGNAEPWMTLTAIIASILRIGEPDTYRRFLDGLATDQDIADALFRQIPSDDAVVRLLHDSIEATIIAVARPLYSRAPRSTETQLPLLSKYRAVADGREPNVSAENKRHAQRVLDYAADIARTADTPEQRSQWIQAVRTVELILPVEWHQEEDGRGEEKLTPDR